MWRYEDQETASFWNTGLEQGYLIGSNVDESVYTLYTHNEYLMWMSPDYPEVILGQG